MSKDQQERPRRRLTHPKCDTCAANEGRLMPPHEASPRCESGRRNHCTCDTCF